MFGYLFPTKEALTMAEKKIFANYFCTLCLAHNYRYGKFSTLFNNFDLGVFAIILNLYGDKIEDCGKCGKNVQNKKEKFTEKKWCDIVDFNINLMRKKLEDDLQDNPKAKIRISYLGAVDIFRKCKQKNGNLYQVFDEEFKDFLAIESRKPKMNEALDAYEIFARNTFGAIDCVQPEQLNLFTSLNRWVYWIDAIDDYDQDIKNGSYNPYVYYNSEKTKTQFLENNMLHLLKSYETHKQAIMSAYAKCAYPADSCIILENIINHTIRKTTKLILENGSLPKRRKLL